MRLLLLILFCWIAPAGAQEEVHFKNDREGQSFYSKRSHRRSQERVLKFLASQDIISAYHQELSRHHEKSVCAYDLVARLSYGLNQQVQRPLDFSGVLYHLRQENELDDVATRILLKAHKTQTTVVREKNENELFSPESSEQNEKILQLITSFENRFLKNRCIDEAYQSFYAEVIKLDKKISASQLEGFFHRAWKEKRIDERSYVLLEKSRVNQLESQGLTLKTYWQKKRTLRTQYPLRDSTEASSFVTQKVKKLALSRRQKLLESYTDLQIILMANIIKTLRKDLESPKIEILVYQDLDTVSRTVTLEPMERFRFAIKSLRREMNHLALNTYFAGRSPDYLDMLTASYELGIIPESELAEIGGLQEIWDPKKTFWDKAGVWVRTFSSVATIVIPPPYGFIPALAVVVIEATSGKKKNQKDDSGSWF
jgi:hypothetical protein